MPPGGISKGWTGNTVLSYIKSVDRWATLFL